MYYKEYLIAYNPDTKYWEAWTCFSLFNQETPVLCHKGHSLAHVQILIDEELAYYG